MKTTGITLVGIANRWLDPHADQYAVTIGLVRGCGTWAAPDGIDASNDRV